MKIGPARYSSPWGKRSPHSRNRSRAVLAGLALALMTSLTGAATASAQLPEFNLLGTAGSLSGNYTTFTTMNMSTGAFSGHATIDGENFSVTGSESGGTVTSTYVYLADPSYMSFNTGTFGILSDGDVGGPGSFHDTNGTMEPTSTDLNLPAGTKPTTTTTVCSPAGSSDRCTAKVSGSGGAPTGNATFSSAAGRFPGSPACVLSGGSCSVSFTAPSGGSVSSVKAVYSGDTTFRVSQGAATSTKPRSCTVPKLSGDTLKAASKALKAAGCAVGKVTKSKSAKVAKGRVISSKPKSRTRHKKGTKVAVVLSRGKH